MSRISEMFGRLRSEGKRGLIPFITAGDPDLTTTRELLIELAKTGASLIEVGVPFSDPIADGPVIQRSSMRSLQNRVDVAASLQVISEARREMDVPVVLFSYFNPLLQFGVERLGEAAQRAAVDGVLVTDLAPEEAEDFAAALARYDLDCVFLAAATSTGERLRLIADRASGFIYAVSRTGVTGEQVEVSSEAEKLVARLRNVTDLPIALGFGISTPEHVNEVCRYADAAVVGSAIVAKIEKLAATPDLVKQIGSFVQTLLPEEFDSPPYQGELGGRS
ncbi:MAG: tryptophan synthase subunit alpha [Pyrinomonadaceae bacterium]